MSRRACRDRHFAMGAAMIAAPIGTLALDVFDATAMIDFTISGGSGSTLVLNADAIGGTRSDGRVDSVRRRGGR